MLTSTLPPPGFDIPFTPQPPPPPKPGENVPPPGSATGGPIWVGEAGPEPFFPQQDGRIISNTEAKRAMREGGGGGARVVNVTINTPVNLADQAFVQREITPYILQAMRQERISDYID